MKIHMHRNIIALAIFLFATMAYSEIKLEDQVSRISRLQGDDYVAERDRLIQELGPEYMHKLRAIRDDTQKDWNIRAQAGILVERHERNAEFVALVETDWLEDPEFDQDWMRYKDGPFSADGLYNLRMRRYREAGFWYHYFEHIWKDITTPGMQRRIYFRRGEADFCPKWAVLVLGYSLDHGMKYHGPDEFTSYLYQWALQEVDMLKDIDDCTRRGWIWSILASNNTRESRQAIVEILKHNTSLDAIDKWHLLNLEIRRSENNDDADMYQAFVDEYLKDKFKHKCPTLIEFTEELIDRLRQKDQP